MTSPSLFRRLRQLQPSTLIYFTVLMGVGAVVLYPLWLLFVTTFQEGSTLGRSTWGLTNWSAIFSEPALTSALGNTVALAVTRQAFALAIGVPIAWLIARTDLPGRDWLEFGFWVAVFLPSVPILVGWILLFDGYTGLANKVLGALSLAPRGPFEIYSWWGIVFVHLLGATLGIKVMFLVPAFRNMDSALEEAGRVCGASGFVTLTRILIPLLTPAILVVTLLGLIQSLEAFEIELVLGAPIGLDVFSTKIYRLLREQPPVYGYATTLSVFVLLLIAPVVLVQQRLTDRTSFATVSGRFSSRRTALGRWKWPSFVIVCGLVLIMTLVPTTFVVLGSFMKIFGAFEVRSPWTLDNWNVVLHNTAFLTSLTSTLILALSTAAIAMVVFAAIAYIAVRTQFGGRGLLDFLTWVPSLLPGIVISLGFLWMFLQSPLFRPLYGTSAVLVAALALSVMTRSVQMVRASLLQVGGELEQAAWVCGAGRWYAVVRVVCPLILPTLLVVGVLAFASASRTASHVALLATANNRPLVLLQLDYLADGNFEGSAVVGVVILIFTLGAAILARALGRQHLLSH